MKVSPTQISVQLAVVTLRWVFDLIDVFIWKGMAACNDECLFVHGPSFPQVSKMVVDVAIAKLVWPIEPQQPHLWEICQFFKHQADNKGWLFTLPVFLHCPKVTATDWAVNCGRALLWSVGNVNTLSDLGLHPDVPDVNICKYRLRQWSHVAQHTYIYHVFKPNTHTHINTWKDHQTLLMALTFAYGLLCRFCAWPLHSENPGGSEYSLLGLTLFIKHLCDCITKHSDSFL